jgi:hypothetical protein
MSQNIWKAMHVCMQKEKEDEKYWIGKKRLQLLLP